MQIAKPPFWLNCSKDLSLLLLAVFLFIFSFPSFLNDDGWGLLGFIALVPLWLLCYRISLKKSFFYGVLYGFASYMILNYWLKVYDPQAFLLVPALYAFYMLFFMPLFVLIRKMYPQKAHLFFPFLWTAYEVIRTKGFAGYTYGQLASSQYQASWLIGISDLGGQLLISLLLAYFSSTLAHLIQRHLIEKEKLQLANWLFPALSYALIFTFCALYSNLNRIDYSEAPKKRVALIQQNMNSWLQARDVYTRAFKRLTRQSQQALEQGAELIIWPETSFVPSYEYLLRERPAFRSEDIELALQLQRFLRQSDADFIIGVNESIPAENLYYNSAMLIENGEISARHRKWKLVPMSENIPFRNYPKLHKFLGDLVDSSPYTPSQELQMVSSEQGLNYGILICYEDTFPLIARSLVADGAQLLVNITNDSWSPEAANTNQHFASALMRSIENRRFMLRAANSGVTAVIDPNGQVLARLPINEQGNLVYDLPIWSEKTTIFNKFGGVSLEVLVIALSVLAFLIKLKFRRLAQQKTIFNTPPRRKKKGPQRR